MDITCLLSHLHAHHVSLFIADVRCTSGLTRTAGEDHLRLEGDFLGRSLTQEAYQGHHPTQQLLPAGSASSNGQRLAAV